MSQEHIEGSCRDGISALTVRMRRNDEEAYREFHRLYFGRLLRYLIVVAGGDEQRARDALQDTLLREEIAQKTQLTEKAVESRLTRARKLLKETILQQLQNERTHES